MQKLKNTSVSVKYATTHSAKQQKETLMSHEINYRLWEKVGADIYTIHSKDHLITVNYFSNFWEIDRLQVTKDSTCIQKLKRKCTKTQLPLTTELLKPQQLYTEDIKKQVKMPAEARVLLQLTRTQETYP